MSTLEYPFTGRCLVSFAPCGCWAAVQMEMRDLRERAKDSARFMREADQDGMRRVEEMSVEAFQALRNGVNADLTWGCDHTPKWGGVESEYDECPRCWKQVKKKKSGGLYAHKMFGWTCSQEPHPRRVTS